MRCFDIVIVNLDEFFFILYLFENKKNLKLCYFIWFIDSFLNFVLNIFFKYFRKGEVWNIYKIKMVRKIMWYLVIEIYFLNMYYVICWVCFEIFIYFL